MMIEFYAALNQWVKDNHLGVTGTIISGRLNHCPVGTKFLTDETGRDVPGQIDAELMALLEESILDVLHLKTPRLITLTYCNESVKIFIDPILPQARLLILGGGHIAIPLAIMGNLLEFQVSVVDDRQSAQSGCFVRGFARG